MNRCGALDHGIEDYWVGWLLLLCGTWLTSPSYAGSADPRLKTVLYSADEVYRLPARVGYEIDLEFQQGEVFEGLGAGDAEGITFKAATNHLFIKPKAANVHTNMTVLTDRRIYRFDYMTLSPDATVDQIDTVYALRFLYPNQVTNISVPAAGLRGSPRSVESMLQSATTIHERNVNYWYCGASQLRPIATWDDGVHTHIQFGANAELPAVFAINEDGIESLVNSNIVDDEVVVHRIVRRLVLRRGRLVGCVLNKSFSGSGDNLSSKTLSPQVERKLRTKNNDLKP
jgi:type IV secretion system protein VirB9